MYAALRVFTRRARAACAGLGTAALLAGCGGGGGGGGSAAPVGIVQTVASPSAPQAFALPSFGGASGTLTLPAGTQVQGAGATLQVALESSPAGVAALQAVRRRPAAVGVTNAQLYVVLQPSQTIALPAFPSFSFNAPASLVLPGENEFLAFFDPAQNGYRTLAGPVTAGAGVVTFVGPPAPLVLAAGQAYVFVLYGIPVPLAGNPVPLPASVGFTKTGQTQTLTVGEQNYGGAFSARSNDGAVVTVSQVSATTFVLTAGSKAGGTSVVVSDAGGHSSLVDVGLTLTVGTVR